MRRPPLDVEVDVEGLRRRFGSPLHVVLGEELDRQADSALGPLRDGFGADVFYSYKTNPVPAVLRRLHDRGIGAEVISDYELWLAQRLGVHPDRIVYNGPAKSTSSLEAAARIGVQLVNANSLGDLGAMAQAGATVDRPLRAGLRISLPHMWGGQFGIVGDGPDVVPAVEFGRTSPHLDLVGLHMHSGLPLRDAAAVEHHAAAAVEFCTRLLTVTGWRPTVLDLGGSLASPTVRAHDVSDDVETVSIVDASRRFLEIVDAGFARLGVEAPRVLIEPGRALTSNTQILVCTVVDVRGPRDRPMLVIDAGVEVAEPARAEHHRIDRVGDTSGPMLEYRLVGADDPHDALVESIVLPQTAPGDALVIHDVGAYFVPFATASRRGRPPIAMVDRSGQRLVRRRETGSDLVLRDV